MINKIVADLAEAVQGIPDGATILVGGFGEAGAPDNLVHALIEQGARELTVVSNNCGYHNHGLGRLIRERRVRKMIVSFPNYPAATAFRELYLSGQIELELVPQGTISERLRAAAAGLGGFYTPTAAHTELAAGKETRVINGRTYVFELPLHADYALVRADRADRWGNLVYRRASRNFNPVMAMAARTTIAEAATLVNLGDLDPDQIHTPGAFVDRVVICPPYQGDRTSLR